jgi:adenylate cyclase class 1
MGTDIKAIKTRFNALNRKRLMRTRESLRPKQQDFLDVLPLLFHINHPSLPGYVSNEVIAGISDYSPQAAEQDAAKRFVNGFKYKRRLLYAYDIYSIFLMGSSGTIAHSARSDFDIWICHRPDATVEQLDSLREKCVGIEKWAEELNLEVHFFLMDAESFRQGQVLDLTSESSGTAQHHLLLDEFYRTGLLIAGRIPMWWLVPPDKEQEYESYVANLRKKGFVREGDAIDFGSLGNMPAEEFFGAAVWHIYKGIDSPYKSVLKILLMEVYANAYPEVGFLGLDYKRAIYLDEDIVLDKLDPYVMLLDRLEKYLIENNGESRIALVRRCFYFKANMPMSKYMSSSSINWQQKVMLGLIKEWGWDKEYLEMLDSRNEWKIDKVLEERKVLVEELTHCYFFLSDFARKQKKLAMISKKDLNVLGRKLYAAFERKSGKLEIVNRGISPDLQEGIVSLGQRSLQEGRESWQMFRGHEGTQSDTEEVPVPLKRSPYLLELLAWSYFNGMIDSRTVFSLNMKDSALTNRELHSIIDVMQKVFPDAELSAIGMDDLLKSPRLLSATVFVNIGTNPDIKFNRTGHVITDRVDALSFGGSYESLIESVDVIYLTSWQEVFVFHYKGISGLLECICQYLQWSSQEEGAQPPDIECNSFSSGYGSQISRRVSDLFNSITDAYFGNNNQDIRYIIGTERNFAMFYIEGEMIKHKKIDSYLELMNQLALPQENYSQIIVDKGTLKDDVLSAIYQYNKPDVLQVFFWMNDNSLNIYVIDERGSLFTQSLPVADIQIILCHYERFFQAILNRQASSASHASSQHNIDDQLEFYIASGGGRNPSSFDPFAIKAKEVKNFFSIQVIGNVNTTDNDFTVYCGDKEFSSIEYGDNLFHVIATYIMKRRLSGERYPIYITDLDISPAILGMDPSSDLQTIHYLKYKKHIENKLNQALRDL